MVIRACRQGFVCQHKCVWNHVETPALKPGLLIWNSRAGSLGAITSRFSGRAAASTPSRCREVSDRRMPHGRPGFRRRAVRRRLAAGGRWIRTIGPCREGAGLYCGDELGGSTGAAKKILRGTDGSNPSPSSRQSVSLPQPLSRVENPAFRAGSRGWLGDRVGRDAGMF